MPPIVYGAPFPLDGRFDATLVIEDGVVVDVIGLPGEVPKVENVELWLPSSEKRRLKERIAHLEEQLGGQAHWEIEYKLLRDKLENPHLYDNKGCPTPEALDAPKGGPIYAGPPVEPHERRRVVTIRERMLELASTFYNRSRDESLSAEARAAWKRAYEELVILRHHGMDRPDLPLCLKCGGIGTAFPTTFEYVEATAGTDNAELRQGKWVIKKHVSCGCNEGFDPNGNIDDVVDD